MLPIFLGQVGGGAGIRSPPHTYVVECFDLGHSIYCHIVTDGGRSCVRCCL